MSDSTQMSTVTVWDADNGARVVVLPEDTADAVGAFQTVAARVFRSPEARAALAALQAAGLTDDQAETHLYDAVNEILENGYNDYVENGGYSDYV